MILPALLKNKLTQVNSCEYNQSLKQVSSERSSARTTK